MLEFCVRNNKSCSASLNQLIMTAYYFDQLSENKQTDVLWEDGAFLDRRSEGYYNILLFQIEGFYAEVYYHAHFNVIIKIETFSDTDRLAAYLDKLDLVCLFND